MDLQSLLVLACAWALLQGEAFKLRTTLILLGISLFAFVFYNFLTDPWNIENPPLGARLAWILPSQTLAVFSLHLVGLAVVWRYRAYAVVFFFASILYAACQQQIYAATFLKFKDISQALPQVTNLFAMAAFAKLILGGIFYGLCFLALSFVSKYLGSFTTAKT